MADTITFVPTVHLDAEANLRVFISMARKDLTVLGEDLDWDSWRWPGVMTFTKIGYPARTNKPETDQLLCADFVDFAKAYMRTMQGLRPQERPVHLAAALRALEAALLAVNCSGNVSATSIAVLDAAANVVRDRFADATRYLVTQALAQMARYMTKHRLVYRDLNGWRSPFRRPHGNERTGRAARKRAQKRMPEEEAIRAIAEIFASDPQDPRDIRTSCYVAMLLCAPSRGHEILSLPVDCEIEHVDRVGNPVYEWRFFAGKGFGATTKIPIPEMVPIARIAIDRIRKLTQPGRDIARKIMEHPDRFPRHPNCPTVSDDAVITPRQACEALGLTVSTTGASRALRQYGIPEEVVRAPTLRRLWKIARLKLPKGWPWVKKEAGVSYANALFTMPLYGTNARKTASPILPGIPSPNVLLKDLSPYRDRNSTIFDRNGYKGPTGERLRLTAHQPRHLLNTLCQRNNLSEILIASMSGRVDVRQNRTYNHMTEEELTEKSRQRIGSMPVIAWSQGDAVSVREPVYVSDLSLQERGPIHLTAFGYCLHDFIQAPCQRYRDCLNCEEHACEKRGDERAKRITARLAEVETDLAAAQKGIDEGYMGADRWYEYHLATVERLRKLAALYDNPEVPDGAIIRLRNPDGFSPLNRAVNAMLARGADGPELEHLVQNLEADHGKALAAK